MPGDTLIGLDGVVLRGVDALHELLGEERAGRHQALDAAAADGIAHRDDRPRRRTTPEADR